MVIRWITTTNKPLFVSACTESTLNALWHGGAWPTVFPPTTTGRLDLVRDTIPFNKPLLKGHCSTWARPHPALSTDTLKYRDVTDPSVLNMGNDPELNAGEAMAPLYEKYSGNSMLLPFMLRRSWTSRLGNSGTRTPQLAKSRLRMTIRSSSSRSWKMVREQWGSQGSLCTLPAYTATLWNSHRSQSEHCLRPMFCEHVCLDWPLGPCPRTSMLGLGNGRKLLTATLPQSRRMIAMLNSQVTSPIPMFIECTTTTVVWCAVWWPIWDGPEVCSKPIHSLLWWKRRLLNSCSLESSRWAPSSWSMWPCLGMLWLIRKVGWLAEPMYDDKDVFL